MKFLWEKLKACKEWVLITVPNRYMGLVLLFMLLVIYFKGSPPNHTTRDFLTPLVIGVTLCCKKDANIAA